MIYGLTPLPQPQIAGLPYGVDPIGFQLDTMDDSTVVVANKMFPSELGNHSIAMMNNNSVLGITAADRVTLPSSVSLQKLSAAATFGTVTPLRVNPTNTGTAIHVSWAVPVAPDYAYTELWHKGPDDDEYSLLITLYDQATDHFEHTNVSSGTHYYYVQFADIYGNIGPTTPDEYQIEFYRAPVLEGEFTFTDMLDGTLVGFTTTSDLVVKIFANYVYGVGVTNVSNTEQMLTLAGESVFVPVGSYRFTAIGYTQSGIPSNAIHADRDVYADSSIPGLQVPRNVRIFTLADGYVTVAFDIDGPWDRFRVLYTSGGVPTVLMSHDAPDTTYTFKPLLADGVYTLLVHVVLTNKSGPYSEPVTVKIDSQHPAGDTTLGLEVL